jgi:hypothetical protein
MIYLNQNPDDAFLIHLDWAVHNYAERLQKIERYDQHSPEGGTYCDLSF